MILTTFAERLLKIKQFRFVLRLKSVQMGLRRSKYCIPNTTHRECSFDFTNKCEFSVFTSDGKYFKSVFLCPEKPLMHCFLSIYRLLSDRFQFTFLCILFCGFSKYRYIEGPIKYDAPHSLCSFQEHLSTCRAHSWGARRDDSNSNRRTGGHRLASAKRLPAEWRLSSRHLKSVAAKHPSHLCMASGVNL